MIYTAPICIKISFSVAFILCSVSLCLLSISSVLVGQTEKFALSSVGHFAICVEILLVIYTVIPLPLYISITICVLYSIVFEIVVVNLHNDAESHKLTSVFIRILMQLCIHILGLHILTMTLVRMRGTFMKVGQSLLVRQQLEWEKQLKEKMIHSVMPPKVADWLMNERNIDNDQMVYANMRPRTSNPSDLKRLFRPFNMNCMENVSILFADIVGFTKMSSNKSAEQLVGLLNDLFEKFDTLCTDNGCEKISTLGDCYYCVSGCPEPRPDHAVCCVEMGLGMIVAMAEFDAERHEGVTMRVGVHTGTVLCGIVGTRRFKFDVWSNDVTLANRMESTGRPKQVHVSDKTCEFLGNSYLLEEGDEVCGHKTYFIKGRRDNHYIQHDWEETKSAVLEPTQVKISPPSTPNSMPIDFVNKGLNNPTLADRFGRDLNNKLSSSHTCTLSTPFVSKSNYSFPSNSPNISPVSAGNISQNSCNKTDSKTKRYSMNISSNMHKITTKPISAGHSPNISPQASPRLLRPANATAKIGDSHLKAPENPFKTKASSLPSILDSDNEEDADRVYRTTVRKNKQSNPWKILKFLRKPDLNDTKSESESLRKPTASNGYQQVPIVIQTVTSDDTIQFTNLVKPRENNLDIRSYINESRSDVTPFGRASSYKHQRCKSEVAALERASSATVPLPVDQPLNISMNHIQNNVANHVHGTWALKVPTDEMRSVSPSVCSRKDSGIRSNSRRSSIQQQIYAMNLHNLSHSDIMQHRVSGYYTSSLSSVDVRNSVQHENDIITAQTLRKQSDLQLIRCVQDNVKSQRSYFVKPPLYNISLFFKDKDMEREYRARAHKIGEKENENPPTLATSKFNTPIDVLVSAVIYLLISISLFLLQMPHKMWICMFMMFSSLQFFALFLCFRNICKPEVTTRGYICTDSVFEVFSRWYPWHFCGAVLLSLPMVAVLTNFVLMDHTQIYINEFYFSYLFFICIVHFCNFTQLNCWMKNIVLTIGAITFIGIAIFNCPVKIQTNNLQMRIDNAHNISVQYNFLKALSTLQPKRLTSPNPNPNTNNITIYLLNSSNSITDSEINSKQTDTLSVLTSKIPASKESTLSETNKTMQLIDKRINMIKKLPLYINHNLYHVEIYIDVILLLILVWFLNREFEISYRLSFHGNVVANQDKAKVQNMKNQADWLLHNIIPQHVADQLKNTAKYSANHDNVGIIFASIVNFNEMYDESYLGGKEYLRVLNELIGDFDELLTKPEFKSVEKIKTIGSTFMAASGLNPQQREEDKNPHAHLFALMDFAIAMQNVIDSFNKDLLEFNLILRIGYNFGEVTAGVIGNTKLYYDIWGDAVNIASRMDSTGVNGRIQIGEHCLSVLQERYEFEERGSVYVKGKDNMNVFLLKKKINNLGSTFDLYDS
ncbi:adenylate cyclase type 9-like [Ctenocephalides felis]|uniref:adenylate cyclase type 9-like n=1 Tax=Ctenocephalides felis TaxID=7515 RepID=UPI000E6E45E0|nr:adenylate cyclase type 9-like [Ctenocephalides felis]